MFVKPEGFLVYIKLNSWEIAALSVDHMFS